MLRTVALIAIAASASAQSMGPSCKTGTVAITNSVCLGTSMTGGQCMAAASTLPATMDMSMMGDAACKLAFAAIKCPAGDTLNLNEAQYCAKGGPFCSVVVAGMNTMMCAKDADCAAMMTATYKTDKPTKACCSAMKSMYPCKGPTADAAFSDAGIKIMKDTGACADTNCISPASGLELGLVVPAIVASFAMLASALY